MSDFNNLKFVEKTSWNDDWRDVPGRWALTRHAEIRLRERYQLGDDDIEDMLEGLDRENLVRVPNNRERENTYTVQTTVQGKGLFLVVQLGTKTIITVLTPFFRFPNELTCDRMEVQRTDYSWPAEEFSLERPAIEAIIESNPPTEDEKASGYDAPESLDEVALYKRGLAVANARIRELERHVCAIKCLCATALDGGKK